jgi:hypothetical protein
MRLVESCLSEEVGADGEVAFASRHDRMGWWRVGHLGTTDFAGEFVKCVVKPSFPCYTAVRIEPENEESERTLEC